MKFPALPDNDKKVDASTYRWAKEKAVILKQKKMIAVGDEGTWRAEPRFKGKKKAKINEISKEKI